MQPVYPGNEDEHPVSVIDEDSVDNFVLNITSHEHDTDSNLNTQNHSICHATKISVILSEELFLRSEALGTLVNPECAGCKCGTCQGPGYLYNLQQQQYLNEIDRNFEYNGHKWRYCLLMIAFT